MDIKLVFYDFDGVMTDNKAYLNENGDESVKINRSDGLGVNMISDLGIKQIILSTEKNKIVKKRANKLKIDCFNNLKDKASKAREISKKLKIDLKDCCFIGNDLNDLEVMKLVVLQMLLKKLKKYLIWFLSHLAAMVLSENFLTI